jgi:hypothetical protein
VIDHETKGSTVCAGFAVYACHSVELYIAPMYLNVPSNQGDLVIFADSIRRIHPVSVGCIRSLPSELTQTPNVNFVTLTMARRTAVRFIKLIGCTDTSGLPSGKSLCVTKLRAKLIMVLDMPHDQESR